MGILAVRFVSLFDNSGHSLLIVGMDDFEEVVEGQD